MRFLIYMLLVVFLPLTLASDTQHRFSVFVSVGGADETITGLLTSHLKRELRALGDVDIVAYGGDWGFTLRVFYVQTETKGGVKTGGLSIASIRETRVPKIRLKDNFSSLRAVTPGTLAAAYWPKDDLQEWCILEVGSFNDNILEKARIWKHR